ncbi:MAG: hypothetical protein ACN4GF_10210 [Lentimonas sp.]
MDELFADWLNRRLVDEAALERFEVPLRLEVEAALFRRDELPELLRV